jgi:hypothetical protein
MPRRRFPSEEVAQPLFAEEGSIMVARFCDAVGVEHQRVTWLQRLLADNDVTVLDAEWDPRASGAIRRDGADGDQAGARCVRPRSLAWGAAAPCCDFVGPIVTSNLHNSLAEWD